LLLFKLARSREGKRDIDGMLYCKDSAFSQKALEAVKCVPEFHRLASAYKIGIHEMDLSKEEPSLARLGNIRYASWRRTVNVSYIALRGIAKKETELKRHFTNKMMIGNHPLREHIIDTSREEIEHQMKTHFLPFKQLVHRRRELLTHNTFLVLLLSTSEWTLATKRRIKQRGVTNYNVSEPNAA
jgi:hypothetical protein